MYQALYRLLCRCFGEKQDIYKILAVAPTGEPAYNVKGLTIHVAFNISLIWKLQYTPLGFYQQNKLQAQHAHLEWILTDEFSMIGNKVQNFMNALLEEVELNKRQFGGISITAIGYLYNYKICTRRIHSSTTTMWAWTINNKFVDRHFPRYALS